MKYITQAGNIRDVPLDQTLPPALRYDDRMVALAAALSIWLRSHAGMSLSTAGIYYRIDELTEDVLDMLAYDFKIDWWDYSYTVEQKRETLKNCWNVYRMKGTKRAIEIAASAIFPDTEVVEWFEYGGRPYFFRLRIDATDDEVNSDRHKNVIKRINYYKTVRSRLEGITYIVRSAGVAVARVGAALAGCYLRTAVNIAVPGPLERPHGNIRVRTAVGSTTYLRMEVNINGVE